MPIIIKYSFSHIKYISQIHTSRVGKKIIRQIYLAIKKYTQYKMLPKNRDICFEVIRSCVISDYTVFDVITAVFKYEK